MFNAVMQSEFGEVKRARGVVLFQHARAEERDEVAEGSTEVVRLLYSASHELERDILPVAREDACAARAVLRQQMCLWVQNKVRCTPWFAIAFSAGHGLRLSVALGGS